MLTIGKFKEAFQQAYKDTDLPSIKALISSEPISMKEKVLDYLKSAKIVAVSPSIPRDVITQERIPGDFCYYSDGKYSWRSDTIYYFEKYNLKLEDEFIQHVLA